MKKIWISILFGSWLISPVIAMDDSHMPLEKKEEGGRLGGDRVSKEKDAVFPEIEARFMSGDYTGVITETEGLTGKRRKKGEDEILYLRGRSYLKLGEFENARLEFSKVISKYPRSQISDRVHLSMADSYFEEGNTHEALVGYEKFIKGFPSSQFLNMALFQLGESYLRKGRWQDAKKTLEELRRRYPLSLEGEEADAILKNGEFFFTLQIGSYKYEKNALDAKDALKKKGYNAYISKTELDGRELYRVRVGKCDTIEEVKELQGGLKKEGVASVIFP